MATYISFIITCVALLFFFNSCTDDTNAFIQKIELTQNELKQQDSILVTYRSDVSLLVFTDTIGKSNHFNDSILHKFLQQVTPLIARLELMIQKNKTLVEHIKTNTGNSKVVQTDYQQQVDEIELMNPEIKAAIEKYQQIRATTLAH